MAEALSRVHQQYKEIATVPLSIKIPAVENPPRVFSLLRSHQSQFQKIGLSSLL